jgi:hypothetical protein
MSKFSTVAELSHSLARKLRRKAWRLDRTSKSEDLEAQIDILENTLEIAREYLKELVKP